ncbi:NADP-dependent oxidoreductase [Cellulomonas sp. PhB150]|uniref:NADP-dependent oxidoreductase n=1 Tax=Cellulomonas sp. PhB150 TaxID=2485188 RepID=UPI000F469DD3|nr:NADP-dependent oxidoreductase [Cellulomonas sp. PhB150]ROS30625.1 NADPH:quinone reductase-like Zn-dependent oxidoreductase [Cellulomonas sp. PhB150]
MRAFAVDAYGSRVHEVERPEPEVGPHDVLVEVAAASINQLDVKIAAGEFKQVLRYPLPLTLGHDLAGTVTAVGELVRRFAVGDRVYGRPRDGRIGTFSERIAVHEDDLAAAPTSIDVGQAASLPLVTLTAWQALVERGGVGAGSRVLIHAGAGGVGSVAIQLAHHLGATVATTASAKNADLVRRLGADLVVDHRTQDFVQAVSGYDLVLDSLGGENLERSLRVLRPGGKAIGISGPPTPEFARAAGLPLPVRLGVGALSAKIRRQARRLGVDYEFLFMRADGRQLAAIADLVDAGVIQPVVGLTVPFAETPEAMAALERGGLVGKVVTARE